MIVAGVDGCRGGWCFVVWDVETGDWHAQVARDLVTAAIAWRGAKAVAVDMPIGLASIAAPGGRNCDREARALLGPTRGASVFSPPSRPALAARSHAEAVTINRSGGPHAPGLSIQCFNLFPRLRELDEWITPGRQSRVRETHPELVFWRLNGRQSPREGKRTAAGRRRRCELLALAGFPEADALEDMIPPAGAARDDLVDACALAVSARDRVLGSALCVGDGRRDERGLRMEIWG